MSYLVDKVSTELDQRVKLRGAGARQWLVIDFADSVLKLPSTGVTKLSLLEGDNLDQLINPATAQFDIAVINLQLAWLDYATVFTALGKILLPGGKLFFATFGPDTLFELRQAWSRHDRYPHVHDFTDLHLLGDQLVRSGFRRPILDADWLGVEFEDIDLLMEDLRLEGFHNISAGRRRTLTGRNRLNAVRHFFPVDAGPAQITFEIVYGFAETAETGGAGIRVNPPQAGQ